MAVPQATVAPCPRVQPMPSQGRQNIFAAIPVPDAWSIGVSIGGGVVASWIILCLLSLPDEARRIGIFPASRGAWIRYWLRILEVSAIGCLLMAACIASEGCDAMLAMTIA